LYFVLENDPGARKDIPEPLLWKRLGLEASWLRALAVPPEPVWKAWAETLQDGARKRREEMSAGTFCLLPWILPQRTVSFLHLQNIFLTWETT
jgi:hypothetical protein